VRPSAKPEVKYRLVRRVAAKERLTFRFVSKVVPTFCLLAALVFLASSCDSPTKLSSPGSAAFGQTTTECEELYPGSPPSDFSDTEWEVVCESAYEVQCSAITEYALNMLLGDGPRVAYTATVFDMIDMFRPPDAPAMSAWNGSGTIDLIFINVESTLYPDAMPNTWRHEFAHRVLGIEGEVEAEAFAESGECPN
jgi:hypothetical protein